MKSASFFLILLVITPLYAQKSVELRGRIVDDSTHAAVPNANVFIANSMLGTSSDTEGRFELKGVPIGSHELVVSCVGYQMVARKLQLFSDEAQQIDFSLVPRIVDFAPVEVRAARPEEWKENLKRFTKLLLGSTREAEDCVIQNPENLVLFSEKAGSLEAQCQKELIVDNAYLGYRLHVSLATFKFDGRWVTSVWKTRFEELPTDDEGQKSDWQKRRLMAYEGSLRHFLRALINGEPTEEGFQMLASEQGDLNKLAYYNPSLKRKNVLSQVSPNVWRLQFRHYLLVVYDRKSVFAGFGQPTYDGTAGGMLRSAPAYRPQISVLSLQNESLLIDLNGQLLDQLALKVGGDWGNEGLAKSLPIEFRAVKKQ